MGVSHLWDLLAPCGRRMSLERLARKKLAVDASIWLIQFVKAMRDEQGDMLRINSRNHRKIMEVTHHRCFSLSQAHPASSI